MSVLDGQGFLISIEDLKGDPILFRKSSLKKIKILGISVKNQTGELMEAATSVVVRDLGMACR